MPECRFASCCLLVARSLREPSACIVLPRCNTSPEIMGAVFGSFIAALVCREWRPRGGSAPIIRFLLGVFAAVGAFVFLLHIQSPMDGTALCVSLTIDGLRPDEIAERLERQHGVLCRPGLHCAPAAAISRLGDRAVHRRDS